MYFKVILLLIDGVLKNMYNVDEDIYPFGHRQMVTLPKGGGGAMSIFETLSLMIAFGTLIALIIRKDK
ncbi:MAG: putative holin-like toxin [Peptoniphilus harei]|nr:putative holin-like toxin [Peptoniphilus harei]